MTETLAIDFGTSRTKVAYWHAQRSCAELMRLERDEPYLLSACYVLTTDKPSENNNFIWGVAAERMLERYPHAVVQALKRDMRETAIKAGRRRIAPQALLTHLFTELRARAEKVTALAGQMPTRVVLTAPADYGLTEERLLTEAAQAAGFSEVELIAEPVAAAQAWLAETWLAETGETVQEVIVLDCGGGTLDWAYLCKQGGQFQVVSECPPGSDRVGGVDVDLALLTLIEEDLDETAYEELEARRPYYQRQMRLLKEDYCQGLPLEPLLIGEQLVQLEAEAIQGVLEERYIRQACEGLQGYLRQVKAISDGEMPTVLLVGGSGQIKGLKEALAETCGVRVLDWERSAFATVLGAVLDPRIMISSLKHEKETINEEQTQCVSEQLIVKSNKVISKREKNKDSSKKDVDLAFKVQHIVKSLSTIAVQVFLMLESFIDTHGPGSLKTFDIYGKPRRFLGGYSYEAVKHGFCWPAFFLNFIWAFFEGLDVQFWSGLILFWLFISVSHNITVSLFMLLPLSIWLGVKGNDFKRQELIKRRYIYIRTTIARTPDEAININSAN